MTMEHQTRIRTETIERTIRPWGWFEIVEVQFGDYLGEDDVVRLSDDYGRA